MKDEEVAETRNNESYIVCPGKIIACPEDSSRSRIWHLARATRAQPSPF